MTSRVLKHLNHTACPTCNAGIKSETFSGRTHCNGQQFESITFQCDAVIEWVPNFERSEIRTPCPKSKESVAKEQRRKQIGVALFAAVKDLNLTEAELAKISRFIRYDWS